MVKAYILYFKTNSIVKLEKKDIVDGHVTISTKDGEKTFDVDNFTPKLLETKFGFAPLYMLKWNSINPATDFNPTFHDSKITPELYNKTMRMKVLGNMLKIGRRSPNMFLMLGIGIMFGVFIMYYLKMMGVV